MRLWGPHLMREKPVGVVALIALSVLGVGVGLEVVRDLRAFKRDLVESTRLIAQVVGDSSVRDLASSDRAAAADTLSQLARLPAVEYACLYDHRGEVFATHGERSSSDPGMLEESARFTPGALHVVHPVVARGETRGTLVLRVSTRGLTARVVRHDAPLVAGLAVLVGLTLLFGCRLRRVISQPLLDLAEVTRKVSETGDYSIRAPQRGNDEVGALFDGFNEMMDQVQMRELERDQVVHRTREKSQFLATMSHELRTPLNSIIGFSEILLVRSDPLMGERQKKFLTNIHRSGQHLLGMINDILDLSAVEAGKLELYPEPVSVPVIVEGVAAVMKGASDKRRVEIRVEGPPDLPPIMADPMKLKQVFYNLLSNAVKFSPEMSVVRVVMGELQAAVSPLGEHSVQVAVADHGIGIAPENHRKVFEPFRQADSGVSRRFEGTGLGLALAKTLVEKHGGVVQLESALGEGSTFTVFLPRKFRGVASGGEGNQHVSTAVDQVLVVESDRLTLGEVRRELSLAGFEVFSARLAQEATDILRRIRPAVVLVDLGLSGAGWETLRDVKMHRKAVGIPVVVFTALEEGRRGLVLGVDDCFFKPLGLKKLAPRVAKLALVSEREVRRALVVDGDAHVHEELESRLVPLGLRVRHARTCDQVLDMASEPEPSVVIIDPTMENMRGFEVAVKMRARPGASTIPMVLYGPPELSRDHRRALRSLVSALVLEGDTALRPLAAAIRRLARRADERERESSEPSAAGPGAED